MTKKETYPPCPKCGNAHPHLLKDGFYFCEKCRNIYIPKMVDVDLVAIDRLLCECKKFYKNSKRWTVYESYKRKIRAMNVPPKIGDSFNRKIAEIIGV